MSMQNFGGVKEVHYGIVRASSELHCTSLLCTILASSAHAHERVQVQNVRDFPQTKLDNGTNSPFLLNELGDPRFFTGIC